MSQGGSYPIQIDTVIEKYPLENREFGSKVEWKDLVQNTGFSAS